MLTLISVIVDKIYVVMLSGEGLRMITRRNSENVEGAFCLNWRTGYAQVIGNMGAAFAANKEQLCSIPVQASRFAYGLK